MQISISGRHITVTDQMKEHLENKLNSVIDNRVHKVISTKVVLSHERNRNKAEIVVNLKNHSFEADAETYEVFEAIDAAIEKIDVQIRRHVEKAHDHRKAPLRDNEPPLSVEESAE